MPGERRSGAVRPPRGARAAAKQAVLDSSTAAPIGEPAQACADNGAEGRCPAAVDGTECAAEPNELDGIDHIHVSDTETAESSCSHSLHSSAASDEPCKSASCPIDASDAESNTESCEDDGAAPNGINSDSASAQNRSPDCIPPTHENDCDPMAIDTSDPDAGFDYVSFLRRMRHPECRPIVAAAKAHIRAFGDAARAGASADALAEMHAVFMDDVAMPLLRGCPVWRLAAATAAARAAKGSAACACAPTCAGDCETEGAGREGLEYLVMGRVHRYAFNRDAAERALDAQVDAAVARHGPWVRPEHLELSDGVLRAAEGAPYPVHVSGLPAEALFELRRTNAFSTPRDKLVCLLNGARLVHNALAPGAGADTLVPLLIYALLKARVGRLHANLAYVQRYRSARRLRAAAYHLTSLQAAAAFIGRMDASALAISADEYGRLVSGVASPPVAAPLPLSPLSSDGGAESPSGLDAAEAVLRALQARLSLASSRSLDYIGKLVDSTEARMRAAGLLGSDDESAPGTDDDERFQTQLAAALSLSEMEAYDLRLRDDDSDGKGPASPEAPRSVCSED